MGKVSANLETYVAKFQFRPYLIENQQKLESPRLIFQDSRGVFWFVYQNKVIVQKGSAFHTIQIPTLQGDTRSNSARWRLVEFNESVLLSVGSAIFQIKYNGLQVVQWPIYSDNSQERVEGTITDLMVDQSNSVWIATSTSIYRWRSNKQHLQILESDNSAENLFPNVLLQLSSGEIWVGSFLSKLVNIQTNSDRPSISRTLILDSDQSIVVQSMLELPDRSVLVGTSNGLYQFDSHSGQIKLLPLDSGIIDITHIQLQDNLLWLVANGKAYFLETNDVGNINVEHLSNSGMVLTPKVLNAKSHLSISEPGMKVHDLFIDYEDSVLISVHNWGLFRFHPYQHQAQKLYINSSQELSRFLTIFQVMDNKIKIVGDNSKTQLFSTQDAIDFVTYSADISQQGTVWLGGFGSIRKIEEGAMAFEFKLNEKFPSKVLAVLQYDDYLWVLSELGGLSIYDRLGNQINLDMTSIESQLISAKTLIRVPDGILLISEQSLSLLTIEESKVKVSQMMTLPMSVVSWSYQNGEFLILHPGQQISWLDVKDLSLSTQNLPIDFEGCAVNTGNVIWYSTNLGQIKAKNLLTGVITAFDSTKGVEINGATGEWCAGYKEGVIFSGYTGFIYIDEAYLKDSFQSIVPRLYVDSVTTSTAKVFYDFDEPLKLRSEDFPIQVEFYKNHYVANDRQTYDFMLNNSGTWQTLNDKQQAISLTQLDSGNHQLQIRTTNYRGDSGISNTVRLSVLPNWWQSKWAYVIYLLCAAIAVYLIVKVRVRSVNQKAQLLEEMIKQRTYELSNAKKHVESLLEQKEVELANVSHEFRTPLTLIQGYTRQLLSGEKEPEKINWLAGITKYSTRLIRLVEQLLDLERFKHKKLSDKSVLNASKLTRSIVDSFNILIQEHKLTLNLNVEDKIFVEIVPDVLEKILINLLSNAIKYTHQGGSIVISLKGDTANRLHLSVKDNGIGISPEEQMKIFERFERVNSNDHLEAEGTGIGLSLVKELVRLHDGTIKVLSDPNQGSEFIISLPVITFSSNDYHLQFDSKRVENEVLLLQHSQLEKRPLLENADEQSLLSGQPESSEKPILLIIDDNHDMVLFLKQLLDNDYHCYSAINGQMGFETAKEVIPDIIICDIMMPVMDGFEFVQTLRSDTLTSHIPIIMLTAKGDRESRLKSWEVSADQYLLKPFDEHELRLQLSNLLEIRSLVQSRFSDMSYSGNSKVSFSSTDQNQADIKFTNQLNDALNDLFHDCDLKVEAIAEEMHMSQRQLLRKVKGLFNMSANEYLRIFRLNKARELLLQGQTPSYVSLEVGFSSHTHFGKCFKAQFGCTPSEFKAGQ